MNFKKSFLIPLSAMFMSSIHSQTIIPLYKGDVPNSKPCKVKEVSPLPGRVAEITVPVLYAYIPEKRDSARAAVIICPGGGYARLAIDHEGHEVAKEFNKQGIAAFVLKYRQPIDTDCIENPETVALMDAQQAIKIVRDGAAAFKINPNNIGIVGFSAGGHLASTLGTHYATSLIPNKENTNLRPDFLVLGYPVISFTDSLAHKGSRDNMLGKYPTQDKIELYSNEKQVTPNTPPTFLIHAIDDKSVKVDNSIEFFMALKRNKVPVELHLLQKGGHGFGLHNKDEPNEWLDWVFVWMKANKLF